ncbi:MULTISPECIES: hypothetical protein [unclassified Mycobacterium]|uniref:hypothetical protein n=1 Tax=unclassified Mycobacterium TaxID=2642494 RepID=UPI000992DFE5|nr:MULTISPECIES: hypothetical protein [unclassified Mycobacterium]
MMKIVLTLGGITLAAILGIAWIWHFGSPKDMDTEIAKSLLSVLTASVVTQAVAIVIYQYNESRKAQIEQDNESRKAEIEKDALRTLILDRINEAFVKVKGLRRRARAHSVVVSDESVQAVFVITQTLYQDIMEELNNVQLQLELAHKDIETNANILHDDPGIFKGVRTMEEYLNNVVDEWENPPAKFQGDPPKVGAAALPKFYDLIGPYTDSQFRSLFVKAYYKTIEEIRKSMTKGQIRRWQMQVRPSTVP